MPRHSEAAPKRIRHQVQPLLASRRSPIVPDALVFEILLRVPVKFLLQFRCVCKSWKSLISDPQFVRMHLQRAHFSHHRLLLFTAPESEFPFNLQIDGVITCSIQSLLTNPSITEVDASYRMTNKFFVVGSCNGLLCLSYLSKESHFFRFWNPSTRCVSEKSPSLDWRNDNMPYIWFAFGYDNLTKNYKVVALLWYPNAKEASQKYLVKVYDVGANSWRKIQNFPYVPLQLDGSGKFVCGTLNWLAFRSDSVNLLPAKPFDQLVMSFDLGKESFGEILLPPHDDVEYSFSNIGVLRDCLCYYSSNNIGYLVVWLMKEYGVKESWTELVTIDLWVVGRGLCESPKPLFMSENGQILLGVNNDELILYNPRDDTLKYLEIKGYKRLLYPRPYIESLVSLCC